MDRSDIMVFVAGTINASIVFAISTLFGAPDIIKGALIVMAYWSVAIAQDKRERAR